MLGFVYEQAKVKVRVRVQVLGILLSWWVCPEEHLPAASTNTLTKTWLLAWTTSLTNGVCVYTCVCVCVCVCVQLGDFPVHGQMERLWDSRLAGMSQAQAGGCVCVGVHTVYCTWCVLVYMTLWIFVSVCLSAYIVLYVIICVNISRSEEHTSELQSR